MKKMKISFFEEYPTQKNLDVLKKISFKTELYIAAHSLNKFRTLEKVILKKYKNVRKCIYWPILKKEEGYWFSVFSDFNGMERVMRELTTNKKALTILWDAELPILNKILILRNALNYFKNKRLILNFLTNAKEYNLAIEIAEYEVENYFVDTLFQQLCLSFNPYQIPHTRIGMLYTSFIKNKSIENYFLKQLEKTRTKHEHFKVGIGCVGVGMGGDEPQLSPKHLARDLNILQKEGIKDIVIYRLGGLTKEHIKILKQFKS
ncbi:hypothetical protein HYY69_06175 [Candidatus Woesearchaeota archaeon]|nr:hypothetical protein [Candidatus Woesearchaeota archaeon]